ncbi:uncharacterized protein LOC131163810 [Malania oleifera]|uniref:uncharacterized protein LOC131163810 n=1 Tax=Malania oleifera TaxID=397392 RepID=UPI0025AE563F|nr:uncharacterized protein LOC131163810 [Malania oleifera]
MVAPLGPGKFYGSSLPRPRLYDDVKLNDERVDPPLPVLDPFLSWANQAHWSMGGLSFTRHRLQGRIEGNIKKLRAQRDEITKSRTPTAEDSVPRKKAASDLTPSAPVAVKKRRFMALIDDDDDEVEDGDATAGGGGSRVGVRQGVARKLEEHFDQVATERQAKKGKENPLKKDGSESVASRTRSRGSVKEEESLSAPVLEAESVKEVRRSTPKSKKLKSKKKSESPSGGVIRVSPRSSKRRLL